MYIWMSHDTDTGVPLQISYTHVRFMFPCAWGCTRLQRFISMHRCVCPWDPLQVSMGMCDAYVMSRVHVYMSRETRVSGDRPPVCLHVTCTTWDDVN